MLHRHGCPGTAGAAQLGAVKSAGQPGCQCRAPAAGLASPACQPGARITLSSPQLFPTPVRHQNCSAAQMVRRRDCPSELKCCRQPHRVPVQHLTSLQRHPRPFQLDFSGLFELGDDFLLKLRALGKTFTDFRRDAGREVLPVTKRVLRHWLV